ncbi:MAG TPA: phage antirepressor KilAC domain-containing protein [Candidatus Anaerotignum merdipullorum]|nr:phage antirepressor KilAC domain-containing protein [Candidatus Anaerotignum merdipullorum]
MGRDLHELLEVNSNYTTWFKRMCDYGFTENIDYATCFPNLESENQHGGQNKIDHQLTIDMAKEICMLQRTEKGKQARQYFIQLEKDWNSPEKVMARALQIARKELDSLRLINRVQQQQIAELSPKATYYDLVLQCPDLISVTEIAKDYGKSAKWLNKILDENKVQFKQGGVWFLYQKYAEKGYTSTKKEPFIDKKGIQHTKPHTYWTQKGRLFLYEFLKGFGYLPIVEQQEEEDELEKDAG